MHTFVSVNPSEYSGKVRILTTERYSIGPVFGQTEFSG